jgi:hypothetical protein
LFLRRLTVVLAMLVLAVGALSSGSAAVVAVDLAYDNHPKFPGARDMAGPRIGWVISKQLNNGSLEVNVEVRRADASTTYFVTIYCGPTHDNAQAVIASGAAVMTNASGAASYSTTIPLATLTAACGAGSHTGHIDLDGTNGATLAATPLEFSS